MTSAPERIWVDSIYRGPEGDPYGEWGVNTGYGVEYIRADLVPQWQPIETAPKDGPDILLAIPVYGSNAHPTHPKQFLRWEYAVAEVTDFSPIVPEDCGWDASDFTHWKHLEAPE